MTLSRNCGFCSASGRFMPISVRSPLRIRSWAENMAASPKTATRPSPCRKTAPWRRPSAGIDGVFELKSQAFTGSRSRLFEGSGEIYLPDGTVAVRCTGQFLSLPLDEISDIDPEALGWRVYPDDGS